MTLPYLLSRSSEVKGQGRVELAGGGFLFVPHTGYPAVPDIRQRFGLSGNIRNPAWAIRQKKIVKIGR